MAKLMNLFSKTKINPLIGSAGVSAVPMAARVSQDMGAKGRSSKTCFLMHAMGPNVAGVVGFRGRGRNAARGISIKLKKLNFSANFF